MLTYFSKYGFVAMLIVGGLLLGLLGARGYYTPKIAREQARVIELSTAIQTQNEAIEKLQADSVKLRADAAKALDKATKATETTTRAVTDLRARLTARDYQGEKCEDASKWLKESWRKR